MTLRPCHRGMPIADIRNIMDAGKTIRRPRKTGTWRW